MSKWFCIFPLSPHNRCVYKDPSLGTVRSVCTSLISFVLPTKCNRFHFESTMLMWITMGLVRIVSFFRWCSLLLFVSVLLGPFVVDGMRVVPYAVPFFLSSAVVPDAVYFVYRDIMRYITETFCGYLREISSVIYGLGLIRVIENGRRCLSRCCRSLLLQNFTVLNKSKLY